MSVRSLCFTRRHRLSTSSVGTLSAIFSRRHRQSRSRQVAAHVRESSSILSTSFNGGKLLTFSGDELPSFLEFSLAEMALHEARILRRTSSSSALRIFCSTFTFQISLLYRFVNVYMYTMAVLACSRYEHMNVLNHF